MSRRQPIDRIEIRNLAITTHLGVPEAERAEPQRLLVSLEMEPRLAFWAMEDRIENTVDYAAVCETVKATAAARPRALLETLAEEIAAAVLEAHPVWKLALEIRKFILPETEYVAVRIERPVP